MRGLSSNKNGTIDSMLTNKPKFNEVIAKPL
jgi:hypothetical protein